MGLHHTVTLYFFHFWKVFMSLTEHFSSVSSLSKMEIHVISGRSWGGREGDNWTNWVFLRLQQPGFLLPKASKLHYALLQWIYKWVQQKDKSKHPWCMNSTVKQDEKSFDIQNTRDGAYRKVGLLCDFLIVLLNHSAGSKAKMTKQKHLRSC